MEILAFGLHEAKHQKNSLVLGYRSKMVRIAYAERFSAAVRNRCAQFILLLNFRFSKEISLAIIGTYPSDRKSGHLSLFSEQITR